MGSEVRRRLRPAPLRDIRKHDQFMQKVQEEFNPKPPDPLKPDPHSKADPFDQPEADVAAIPRHDIAAGTILNSLRAYFCQHAQRGCALTGNSPLTEGYDPLAGVTFAPAFVVIEATIPSSYIKKKVFQLVRAHILLTAMLTAPPKSSDPLLVIAVNGAADDADNEIKAVRNTLSLFAKHTPAIKPFLDLIHVIHVPLVCIHFELRSLNKKIDDNTKTLNEHTKTLNENTNTINQLSSNLEIVLKTLRKHFPEPDSKPSGPPEEATLEDSKTRDAEEEQAKSTKQ